MRFLLRCLLLPFGFLIALSLGALATAVGGLAQGTAWVARRLGSLADACMAALCAQMGIQVRVRDRAGVAVTTSWRAPHPVPGAAAMLPEVEPLFGSAGLVRAANRYEPRFGMVSRAADAQSLVS